MYIDFRAVAQSKQLATDHFKQLQGTHRNIGQSKLSITPTPRIKKITWLILVFNTLEMLITIPPTKMHG